MRILFITRKFPPSIGGMELFAKDLSDNLSHKIDLKLVKWGGGNKALPVIIPYLWFAGVWQLLRGGVDIIHIQDGLLSPIGFTLAKLFRKPFTVEIHGLDITFPKKIYQMIVPRSVSKADIIFCISKAAADEAIKRGVPSQKTVIIPLAVEDKLFKKSSKQELIEELKINSKNNLLLTVGRMTKRKGVAWFIEAVLPQLVRDFPDILYLVVGDGKERVNIESAITRNKMEPYVKLLGRVEDDLYQKAYNGADIFIMPNINVPGDMEGFGLVLLEASLCQLPVVASDTEGIRDALVDGKNGKLVHVKDVDAFYKEILNLIKNPKDAKSFGENSRKFTLENYSWDEISNRYIENYQKLIK